MRFARLCNGILEARILRTLLAVEIGRNVPRLLVGKRIALTERHIGFGKPCRVRDRTHAGAPVE